MSKANVTGANASLKCVWWCQDYKAASPITSCLHHPRLIRHGDIEPEQENALRRGPLIMTAVQ